MDAWEYCRYRADDSLDAAGLLHQRGHSCSAASRAYYAAYQAVTAVLLYAKQRPPAGRDAWSHEVTPELLRTTRMSFLDQNKRYNLSARLSVLYKLRITADYEMRAVIGEAASATALKDAHFIVKSVGDILPPTRSLEN